MQTLRLREVLQVQNLVADMPWDVVATCFARPQIVRLEFWPELSLGLLFRWSDHRN